MAFVSVEFEFEYKTKDGQHISIKPNECYILVSKTNDNWWRVCKDRDSKHFYVPVEYVKEVSAPLGGPSGPKKSESSKSLTKSKPVDGMKHKGVEKTKKTSLDTKTVTHSVQDDSKETYRFSTFGLWVNMPSEALKDSPAARNRALSLNYIKKPKTPSTSGRVSITPEPIVSEDQELYAKPWPAKKLQQVKNPKQEKSTEELRASLDDKDVDLPPPYTYDMDFPPPPPHFYDTTPEISITDCDSFPEPPEPLVSSPEESAPQHQSSDQTAEKACITDEKFVSARNDQQPAAYRLHFDFTFLHCRKSSASNCRRRSCRFEVREWRQLTSRRAGTGYEQGLLHGDLSGRRGAESGLTPRKQIFGAFRALQLA
ncbi:hypothetical protein CRENBAI_017532 [Crenichthys baileyi]|uniref:SH3 domain-containing protein n=1 Tax=Crenichthys baileyi TaxID=28760 RepID=A0AAV9R055_9TELE